MSEIAFPARLEELADSSVVGFRITSPELIMGMDGEEITQYMQDLIEGGMDVSKDDVADKVVDFVYCTIDMFPSLSQENQSMFVQYLLDISKTCVELLPTANSNCIKNTYKKVLYLFQHFCIKAEAAFKNGGVTEPAAPVAGKGKAKKNAKNDNFSWVDFRHYALEVLDLMVSSPLSASWPMGLVQENFLSGVWNYTLKLLIERPAGVSGTAHKEVATRNLCVKIFARTVGHFGNAKSSSSYATVSTALLEAVVQFEHMAVSTGAELCAQCKTLAVNQGSQIIAEILSEISRMNYTNMPATSVKNIASFIESFAKAAPASVSEAFPILMKQLDSPAHQIRSAIIQACGYIVTHIHESIVSQAKASTAQNAPAEGESTPAQEDHGADEGRNTTGMVRSRDNILDILTERVHDVNPYTRAAVLKVWSRLLESGSLPVKRVGGVAAIAVDRLFDKNAAVRRNAVVLMTTVIENNPFSGTLDASLYRFQQAELLKSVAARLTELRVAYREGLGLPAEGTAGSKAGSGSKKDRKSGELAAISEDAEDEERSDEEGGEDATAASAEQAELEEDFLASAEVVEDSQLAEHNAKLEYIASVLSMISSIESAVPKIATMLQSKTTGDVVEALRFFTRAINFKIAGALALFKSAFSLVWHQDPAIKAEMLQAFSAVYLTDGASEHAEALAANEVAHNLMHLVRHCDAAEMTSMEKIVGEMYHSKQVEEDAVEAIWDKIEKFSHTLRKDTSVSGTSDTTVVTPLTGTAGITELGACLRIVSMIAHTVPSILSEERVGLVISAGLAPEVLQKGDFSALKAAVLCLQASPPFLKNCITVSERNAYVGSKLQVTLLEATPMITTIMMGTHCGNNEAVTREWFAVCEEAMHSLFHLHPTPDKVAALVLQHMYANLSSTNTAGGADTQSVFPLARLLFVLGQTSLCSLVYTELLAACAKKYPIKDTETGKKAEAQAMVGSKKVQETGAFKEDSGAVDAMEEEMGAAAAADADHERLLNQVIEQELVMKNILGKFLPLLSYMVANEQQKFSHPLLRETSILALCRYMCTSSVACESLLPLLFTVLERETAVSVRTTVMIALGDLAFRFPNSIEPWTHRMYSRLRDDNVTVRYNTLMVITHLVLNDMIKVKGQVSHVAHSLNDPNEAIAELAKLFFIKLSERSNNPVYNLLGDIISIFSQDVGVIEQASQNDVASAGAGAAMPALTKEQFQTTMHFLLSFVQKDKQADTLLERLLLRMSMSPSLLQRRNLAFCISELSVTEKGVKKMIELIKNIKDALYDNEVYECFRTTLARAKKVVRGTATAAETKTAMEDFEQLMQRIHSQANGEEMVDPEGGLLDMGDVAVALEALDHADVHDSAEEGGGAPTRATRVPAATKGGKAKPTTKAPAKKTTKPKAAAKKSARGKRGGDSSDEGEQSESELSDNTSDVENRGQNQTKATKGAAATVKKAPARSVRRAAVVQSDDEEE